LVALGLPALTREAAADSPPAPIGPCAEPALASIAVRPGLGRAPATGGAACVAEPGEIAVGLGFRYQVTIGAGRQNLAVYPGPVFLIGLPERNELIVSPSLIYSNRSGTNGSALMPAAGEQDAGFGLQHVVSDRPWTQQAVSAFATFPTGYPAGSSGFSAGVPAYTFAYTIAFGLGGAWGLSTSQGVVVSSGANASGSLQRYAAYQPTVNLTYALSPLTTLLLEDQITTPTGPSAPTENRALAGVQRTLSRNVVLDVEAELNLLPAPGLSQHALGAGVTVRL
jgi:hypothetical protein